MSGEAPQVRQYRRRRWFAFWLPRDLYLRSYVTGRAGRLRSYGCVTPEGDHVYFTERELRWFYRLEGVRA